MSTILSRVTRTRLLASLAILVVATAILYVAGVGMPGYLTGVAIGIVAVVAVIALTDRYRTRAN